MKKKQSRPPLAREEWDFANVQDWHLRECYAWEYARTSETYRKEIEIWRKSLNIESPSFDALWSKAVQCLYHRVRFTYVPNENLKFFCVFAHSPEWPAKPFLRVDQLEAAKRMEMVDDLLSRYEDKPEHFMRDVETGLCVLPIKTMNEGNAWLMPSLRNTYPDFDAIVVLFDRTLSDKALLDKAKVQLKKRDHSKVVEKRGSDWSDVLRGKLNQLGALRVLRHTKGDWNEAATITQNENGDGLYSSQARWLEARKSAKKILETEFNL